MNSDERTLRRVLNILIVNNDEHLMILEDLAQLHDETERINHLKSVLTYIINDIY